MFENPLWGNFNFDIINHLQRKFNSFNIQKTQLFVEDHN